MLISTTSTIEGKKIKEYRGIVFGEVINGIYKKYFLWYYINEKLYTKEKGGKNVLKVTFILLKLQT